MMQRARLAWVLPLALLSARPAVGLNNGVGTRPGLGWSSWYCSPDGSQVTSAFVRANAEVLVSSGLASKGYVYVNVDEGWLKGRYPNGTIYEDLSKFPEGMAGLGAWVHAQETSPGSGQFLRYGLYTCRGTCQCSTDKYSAPGSAGYEAADVDWMAAADMDWLKVDSCCASQDHATAFREYGLFRDALNATGRRVLFNLCGWNPWYAPPDPALNYSGGASLGNSWRIDGDGGSWAAITSSINVMAGLGNYTGPGGYNDPDNVLGPHGTVGSTTPAQAEAQFLLWALFPAPIILGEDLTQATPDYLATVGNEELLAINQDEPFVGPATRVAGGDLSWPCTPGSPPLFSVQATPCGGAPNASAAQAWVLNASDSSVRLASQPGALLSVQDCGTADGTLAVLLPPGGGSCGGANQQWQQRPPPLALGAPHPPRGSPSPKAFSLVNPATGKCLDEYMWTTPRVDIWDCLAGATNLAWTLQARSVRGVVAALLSTQPCLTLTLQPNGQLVNDNSSLCLTATPAPPAASCTNVWARPLSDGGTAFGFVNNGGAAANVTCDEACFTAAGISAVSAPNGLSLRDLLRHADLPSLVPPYLFTAEAVPGGGGGAAFKVMPLPSPELKARS